MNIFVLDENPSTAAKYLADKHVVKMLLESIQMLSTSHRVLDGDMYTERSVNNRSIKRWKLGNEELETTLYKATHINHPCNIWLRESINNYWWLLKHTIAIDQEYQVRYRKSHKSSSLIPLLYYNEPRNIPNVPMTTFRLAMPDQYKSANVVESYREYYRQDKKHLLKYTYRNAPDWI